MLAEVARINDEAVQAVIERLRDEVRELSGSRVAVLGLSFKPETDDVCLSPVLALAGRLLELGVEVVGFDPERERTQRPSSRGFGSRPIRTTRRAERTRSCSPLTGPSSAISISPASKAR
jgi:UDP-glucose 6-dehydrogenase